MPCAAQRRSHKIAKSGIKKKKKKRVNNFLGDLKHPPLCILRIIVTIINDDLLLFFHRVISAKETH